MKTIKDELQNIILGDEQIGSDNKLKKAQSFLRGYAEASISAEKQQRFKDQEAAALINFALANGLFYSSNILQKDFISEGAEQRVYRLDEVYVLKTNQSVFYETWLDYFNSLLIHNFFFPTTAYTFLGLKLIDGSLNAVVKQEFIISNQHTNLNAVNEFLEFN